jgi:hypothetical protein
MLFTVSTVKDTLPNVQRFVSGNLAGGVDHLFVFLDSPDPGVLNFLDAHPHVTCVTTDDSWWRGDRPEQLNVRQRINANLVKVLLSHFDFADWLFHIDADEIVQIDRGILDAVPRTTRAVRLTPLEAVSRKHWNGDPTWFKQLLDDGDLTLLHVLGVIAQPANGSYFHGHVAGKTGLRPGLDLWLTLHHIIDGDWQQVEPYSHEQLRLLHYESYSGEDFVRKWTAMLAAGPKFGLRPGREPTAVALRVLIAKGLSADQAKPYLMRIFERTTEDDFDTLRDLGLLEEIDPRQGAHVPSALPPGARERLDEVLGNLTAEPKRIFHPKQPPGEDRKALERATGLPVRAGRSFLRRS